MKMTLPKTVAAADLLTSTIVENDYPAWSSATPYTTGTRCIVVADHAIYEALQPSTNKPPADNLGTYWVKVSATNRWLMFDDKVYTQSTAAESLIVQVACGAIDTLGLINIAGATVHVSMQDSLGATVYQATEIIDSDALVTDWYSYFFSPRGEIKTDLVLSDLPPCPQATIQVTISKPGGTVGIGLLLFGLSATIGTLLWGPTASIIDYSKKELDEFGNPTLVVRNYAKLLSCDLRIPTSQSGALQTKLARRRGTRCLWVGCAQYTSTIVYGFLRSFSIVLSGHNYTDIALEVVGMI